MVISSKSTSVTWLALVQTINRYYVVILQYLTSITRVNGFQSLVNQHGLRKFPIPIPYLYIAGFA